MNNLKYFLFFKLVQGTYQNIDMVLILSLSYKDMEFIPYYPPPPPPPRDRYHILITKSNNEYEIIIN